MDVGRGVHVPPMIALEVPEIHRESLDGVDDDEFLV